MASPLVTRTLTGARAVRRLPVARLLALADVIVLAREHLNKLEPDERRRLVELVKIGRLTRGHLSRRERGELNELVNKTEPKRFLNRAVQKVAGVPIPRRAAARHCAHGSSAPRSSPGGARMGMADRRSSTFAGR